MANQSEPPRKEKPEAPKPKPKIKKKKEKKSTQKTLLSFFQKK